MTAQDGMHELRLAGDVDQEIVLTKWSFGDEVVFRFTIRDVESDEDVYLASIDVPAPDCVLLALAPAPGPVKP